MSCCCQLIPKKTFCFCQCHYTTEKQKINCCVLTLIPYDIDDRYIDICQFCNLKNCKCCQTCIPRGFILCQCKI